MLNIWNLIEHLLRLLTRIAKYIFLFQIAPESTISNNPLERTEH